ncbi:hypothetical protein H696_02075 [Fonticula alba]|uniref:Uncharacterized protein n=1 Tax=Fonticula alba TaxID=691883 RepID=A0A058ZA52_FONAL|nr:hypothetical protein H696_02075 [Fonticula alba]KCV71125.1 hypothetical protein H696_02075 [Fonticula alba]|eukprot:XP_009494248.1 hypothetical protein H696_02075 [Fonticula alba]
MFPLRSNTSGPGGRGSGQPAPPAQPVPPAAPEAPDPPTEQGLGRRRLAPQTAGGQSFMDQLTSLQQPERKRSRRQTPPGRPDAGRATARASRPRAAEPANPPPRDPEASALLRATDPPRGQAASHTTPRFSGVPAPAVVTAMAPAAEPAASPPAPPSPPAPVAPVWRFPQVDMALLQPDESTWQASEAAARALLANQELSQERRFQEASQHLRAEIALQLAARPEPLPVGLAAGPFDVGTDSRDTSPGPWCPRAALLGVQRIDPSSPGGVQPPGLPGVDASPPGAVLSDATTVGLDDGHPGDDEQSHESDDLFELEPTGPGSPCSLAAPPSGGLSPGSGALAGSRSADAGPPRECAAGHDSRVAMSSGSQSLGPTESRAAPPLTVCQAAEQAAGRPAEPAPSPAPGQDGSQPTQDLVSQPPTQDLVSQPPARGPSQATMHTASQSVSEGDSQLATWGDSQSDTDGGRSPGAEDGLELAMHSGQAPGTNRGPALQSVCLWSESEGDLATGATDGHALRRLAVMSTMVEMHLSRRPAPGVGPSATAAGVFVPPVHIFPLAGQPVLEGSVERPASERDIHYAKEDGTRRIVLPRHVEVGRSAVQRTAFLCQALERFCE